MAKKLTFGQRLIFAFAFCLAALLIGEAVRLPWLYNAAWTLVGLTFLIWPDVPSNLKIYWSPDKCRRFGRLLGVCCIIGTWLSPITTPR